MFSYHYILNSQKIEKGAFAYCNFEKVTISNGTIWAESFEDCEIKEFYFGKDVFITTDPTDGENGILGCEDMTFYVYEGSNAE